MNLEAECREMFARNMAERIARKRRLSAGMLALAESERADVSDPDVRFRSAIAVECSVLRRDAPARVAPFRARGGTRYGRKVVSLNLLTAIAPRPQNEQE